MKTPTTPDQRPRQNGKNPWRHSLLFLPHSAAYLLFVVAVPLPLQANPIQHTINLSPSHPEDEWQVDLQPQMSAKLTVTIEETGEAQGGTWQLRGQPTVDIVGDQILWTGSMQGLGGQFNVTNTAPGSQAAVLKVACEWVPVGTGGGGGGPPPVIPGLATGIAIPAVLHVSWSFHPLHQLADGFSAIQWNVFFYDSEGQPVNTDINQISPVGLSPFTTAWNLFPETGTGAMLSGTVTSGQVSTGRLHARFNSTEEATSDTILSFGAPPFLEVYTPLE